MLNKLAISGQIEVSNKGTGTREIGIDNYCGSHIILPRIEVGWVMAVRSVIRVVIFLVAFFIAAILLAFVFESNFFAILSLVLLLLAAAIPFFFYLRSVLKLGLDSSAQLFDSRRRSKTHRETDN